MIQLGPLLLPEPTILNVLPLATCWMQGLAFRAEASGKNLAYGKFSHGVAGAASSKLPSRDAVGRVARSTLRVAPIIQITDHTDHT